MHCGDCFTKITHPSGYCLTCLDRDDRWSRNPEVDRSTRQDCADRVAEALDSGSFTRDDDGYLTPA